MMLQLASFWVLSFLQTYFLLLCYGQDLIPDCSALTPQPCDIIPLVDSDGEYTYDSYVEECNSHQCTTITPSSASYTWTDPNTLNVLSIESWFCNGKYL
eukprot:c1950_g1_i2 orf=61-357(-)